MARKFQVASAELSASRTVKGVVGLHKVPASQYKVMGVLAEKAKGSESFYHFLNESIPVFLRHRVKTSQLNYNVRAQQNKSNAFDYKRYGAISGAYTPKTIKSSPEPLVASEVIGELVKGTKATARDKVVLGHMFDFYKLVHTNNPRLQQAIRALGKKPVKR
ncbi:MAG: hypothetical protein WCX64_00200 [Candidatus Micrarchaeia archaeon]